jgi:non-ribosomal peptide synthetase component F
VAMLGVLKAGGAFVPLDPSHPRSRLQALVRSISATILLCSPQHATSLKTVADSIVPLDGWMVECLSTILDERRAQPLVRSSNAAYLIFTSGSTGQPKVCRKGGAAFIRGADVLYLRVLWSSTGHIVPAQRRMRHAC